MPTPRFWCCEALSIPPFGGDTVWSNTAAAYLDLPPPLRSLADELWAVHCNAYDDTIADRGTDADKKYYDEVYTRTIYETEHPVVRVHPETGERALVLGDLVQRFVGIPKYDGQKLFDLFQSRITAPENLVRWNWKQGDVAIWTTAPRNIMQSMTTATSLASFVAPPSMARCPSASMGGAA